jgi:hypothetical protein
MVPIGDCRLGTAMTADWGQPSNFEIAVPIGDSHQLRNCGTVWAQRTRTGYKMALASGQATVTGTTGLRAGSPTEHYPADAAVQVIGGPLRRA